MRKQRQTISVATRTLINKNESALAIMVGIFVAAFFMLAGAIALLMAVSGWIIIWQDGLGLQEILILLPYGLLGAALLLLSASIIREFIIILPKKDLNYKLILLLYSLLALIVIILIFYFFSLFARDLLFSIETIGGFG